MGKLEDIKILLQKMFKKNKSGVEVKKDDENPSMIESEQPKIFGVRRSVVIAIFCGILVTFFLAIWWSVDSSISQIPQKQEKALASKPTDVADRTGLPNDYANLPNYDKKKAMSGDGTNRTNGQPKQNQALAQNQQETSKHTEVPQIPQRNYSSVYQVPSGVPLPMQPPVSQIEEEKYNAAIAFALGKDQENTTSTDTAATITGSAATPASFNSSYTALENTMLQAGTIIPVILMTGINSDINGQVAAQVQADVCDSLTGYNLLIPSGSRLIGEYASGAGNGQSRIGIKWNTLLLPNGGSWSLGDSMTAVDGAGYAGIAGKVNNHTSKVLGAGAYTSALAALGGIAAGNTSGTNDNYSAGQLAAQGAMSNLLNTASSLFQKNMNVQPTITIEPGYQFNILLIKPISLRQG